MKTPILVFTSRGLSAYVDLVIQPDDFSDVRALAVFIDHKTGLSRYISQPIDKIIEPLWRKKMADLGVPSRNADKVMSVIREAAGSRP